MSQHFVFVLRYIFFQVFCPPLVLRNNAPNPKTTKPTFFLYAAQHHYRFHIGVTQTTTTRNEESQYVKKKKKKETKQERKPGAPIPLLKEGRQQLSPAARHHHRDVLTLTGGRLVTTCPHLLLSLLPERRQPRGSRRATAVDEVVQRISPSLFNAISVIARSPSAAQGAGR